MLNKIEKVEAYKASITKESIDSYGGVVRVWDRPESKIEGAQIIGEIKEPIEVTVVEEQKDIYGSTSQRARIIYDNHRGGWVLYHLLTRT